jgi:choline dehydrogenase
MYGGPQQPAFIQTIQTLTGIARYKDLNGGTPNCVSVTPLSLDWHRQDHRSSSAEAYLTPVQSQRTWWTTLTTHMVRSIIVQWAASTKIMWQVTKILWASNTIPLKATGIEFAPTSSSSARYFAYARREVILAAGAIAVCDLLLLRRVVLTPGFRGMNRHRSFSNSLGLATRPS